MTPRKRSFKVEARPVNRRSDMLIETQATSHSASESEYEERKSQLRRNRKRATRISGRRVIFQRGKADMRKAPQRAISASSSSSSEDSSDGNIGDEVEGEQGESPTPSSGLPLKWKGMVYPGVPQIGYAFSYASGPVRFLQVPSRASKCLAAHWRSPQSYVAYVIYSLHPFAEMNNKLQGLEMVNELAAHGFIEDVACNVLEEIVQSARTLTFQWGDVAVSIPNLGDAGSLRGYWPASNVDEEDRKVISAKLQSVMHDRALAAHAPASPQPVGCSGDPRLGGSTATPSSEEDLSSSSGKDASLEDSALVKFVRVHWRQSKWAADNLHRTRSRPSSHPDPQTNSDGTGPGDDEEDDDDSKAVVLWSSKADKKEGLDLLERIVRARQGNKRHDHTEEHTEYEDVMEGGDLWLVYQKDGVVVGFPGRYGDEEFVESVQAMEK